MLEELQHEVHATEAQLLQLKKERLLGYADSLHAVGPCANVQDNPPLVIRPSPSHVALEPVLFTRASSATASDAAEGQHQPGLVEGTRKPALESQAAMPDAIRWSQPLAAQPRDRDVGAGSSSSDDSSGSEDSEEEEEEEGKGVRGAYDEIVSFGRLGPDRPGASGRVHAHLPVGFGECVFCP